MLFNPKISGPARMSETRLGATRLHATRVRASLISRDPSSCLRAHVCASAFIHCVVPFFSESDEPLSLWDAGGTTDGGTHGGPIPPKAAAPGYQGATPGRGQAWPFSMRSLS